MELIKKEMTMTKGVAILSMLVLHLFCRVGNDVFGEPLLWLNKTTPLVYMFGFFGEICVPIYSFCAGYAQGVLSERGTGKNLVRTNLFRILKLLINYWIILILFSILGLFFDPSGTIPGNWVNFIKSIFLLHSYNGAWWFLNAYILAQVLSPLLLRFLGRIKRPAYALTFCILFQLVWSLLTRFINFIELVPQNSVFVFLATQLVNFIGIMPCFLLGILFRKTKIYEKIKAWCDQRIQPKKLKLLIILAFLLMITGCYLVGKTLIMPFVAILTVILFNLYQKSRSSEKVFLFLGKHSTNIWLTHMFFYSVLFEGLALSARYPILILLFMLLLCVVTSYLILLIYTPLVGLINKRLSGEKK